MNDKHNKLYDKQPQILIIGGTTEGRIAVKVCDESAKPFFYSTKNASQKVDSAHSIRISGGLDDNTMATFCHENNIRLIIDAAHPFAQNVHNNIGITATKLNLPTIRFERKFPPYNKLLRYFDSFDDVIQYLYEKNIDNLLVLSGVNSVSKMKRYWQQIPCFFRIMKREESMAVVNKYNFPHDRVIFYDDHKDDLELFERLKPKAILTKESGESGGFSQKIETAIALGIEVLVMKRPRLPYSATATIEGEYGLRKAIENLLPNFFELKTGFTSGSCATAATKAALTMILTGKPPTEIIITLPNEERVVLPIYKCVLHSKISATATIIKDSGDDPDVTKGFEICSTVALNPQSLEIRFLQGEGVGKVTLPGLGIDIGDPAINPTPRMMMRREVQETLEQLADESNIGVDITISLPRGREIATRTFNPKLGIVDGISILGTSGIIKPFSKEAFVKSIGREIQVAKALDVRQLVLNSGAKSERYLKNAYPNLISQAFIQYGNFIGESLQMANNIGFDNVVLGVMIGKAVKLAEGKLDTHSKKAIMNKEFIQSLAKEAQCSNHSIEQIGNMTLARELWRIIPKAECHFFDILKKYCHTTCSQAYPNGKLTLFLIDDDGNLW
ncbi:MAG: precorrin-6x reductase [Bacteroidales bacterium]|nr:MAG: precorrin-6x reductase [Bacteroidales bacterium]